MADRPLSVTGTAYDAAMLDVESGRALRSHPQVGRLVAAVESAEPHDEADWIEWKSDLDLGSHEGRGSLARHILGLANRDPGVASRFVGGCGYLLVGVEPGACHGTDPIDPADLESQIQPFLGDDGPVWQALWVTHGEGKHVLVIVVDPPSQGDPIHALRKSFGKYQDGDVFVRRMGATHRANSSEIQRLAARTHAATEGGRLAVELVPIEAPRVMPLDCSSRTVSRWLEGERERLLRPMEEHLAVEAEAQDEEGSLDDMDPLDGVRHPSGLSASASLPSTFNHIAEQMRAVDDLVGHVRKPEERSPDTYREQVQAYLDEAEALAEQIAADRHVEQEICRLRLAVRNPTDYPFRDVEVELYVPGEGVQATVGHSLERLPSAPRPWGDRWVDPYGHVLGGALMPDSYPDALVPHIHAQDLGPSVQIDNGGSAILRFPSLDLPPRSARSLDEFHLLVPAEFAGQQITARWEARSTSVPGVVEGTIAIQVEVDAVDAGELLDLDSSA